MPWSKLPMSVMVMVPLVMTMTMVPTVMALIPCLENKLFGMRFLWSAGAAP